MINFFSKYKIIFYLINLCIIFLYLYPGSIFGWIIYDDLNIQPKLTRDFFFNISSNHFYAFVIIAVIGFFSHIKPQEIKFLIIFLIFLSIILELFHLFIDARTFQLEDLFGNLFGVIIVIFINFLIRKYGFLKK
mgnify:FL=1